MPETSRSKLLFLTTADTEILAAARASERLPEGFPMLLCANPIVLEDPAAYFERELPGAGAVLVRLLGGRKAWPEGLEELRWRCARLRVPLLAFGGEAEPDAQLTVLSTVPSGTVLEAFEYLRDGGVRNTENLLRFVADTVLMEGYGFEPASPLPEVGVYHPGLPEGSTGEELLARHDPSRPTVGVIFYRAHWMSGNTAFVDALVEALEAAGADALPVYCYSLRGGPERKSRLPRHHRPRRWWVQRGGRQEIRLSPGVAGVGRPGTRRARSPRHTGHLHDLDAGGLARLGRRPLPARHSLAGGHTGVRRAHYRGPLLVQGTPGRRLARRRPAHPLQSGPRTHRPPRRARGALRQTRAYPELGEESRRTALQLPDQALAGRERRGTGYAGERHQVAGRNAGGGLYGGGCARERGRTHPLAHRGWGS